MSHTDPPEEPIIVTGIAGNLGKLVMRELATSHQIFGIDRRTIHDKPNHVVHVQVDMRRKKAQDVFRTSHAKTVIHLGIMHDPRMSAKEHYMFNVVGTENLLEYCARYGIKKLIMLSSANNYGPLAGASAYQDEDAPLLGAFAFPEIRDLVAVDHAVGSFFWKYPQIETVILRPVHVVGRTLKNAPSNYLRLKALPYMLGFDPLVQLIHELDVVKAIRLSLKSGVRGIFNIVGPPVIPLSKLLQALGKPLIPVLHPIAKPLWKLFYAARLSHFPAPEWDFLKYELLVDGARANRELGFSPDCSMQQIIDMFKTNETPAQMIQKEIQSRLLSQFLGER